MSNKTIERSFQGAAVLLVLAAAYYLWEGDRENVFIFAALGSLCFFIGFRFQVKERNQKREEERNDRNLPEADHEFEAGFPGEIENTQRQEDSR